MIARVLGWLVTAVALVACGGGAGSPSAPPTVQKLVGEVFFAPSEIPTAELRSTIGYSGYPATSGAIQNAGKQNILDLLFLLPAGDELHGRPRTTLSTDAEPRLIQYAATNKSLLVPGIRVLVADEIYWNPVAPGDGVEALQLQLNALGAAIALVRKHIPQASVGITVTPYAAIGKPNTLNYIKQAVGMVDWVGTDPYWFGETAGIADLHDWSRTFHALAKQANPRVETWFIAQAFKFPQWDLAAFNSFIAQQLTFAEQYDHILFFGWQFVSELDMAAAGVNFPADTKLLYKKYFK
jgi:hypothetical protein